MTPDARTVTLELPLESARELRADLARRLGGRVGLVGTLAKAFLELDRSLGPEPPGTFLTPQETTAVRVLLMGGSPMSPHLDPVRDKLFGTGMGPIEELPFGAQDFDARSAARIKHLVSVADDPERIEGDIGRTIRVARSVLRPGDIRITWIESRLLRVAELIGVPFPDEA